MERQGRSTLPSPGTRGPGGHVSWYRSTLPTHKCINRLDRELATYSLGEFGQVAFPSLGPRGFIPGGGYQLSGPLPAPSAWDAVSLPLTSSLSCLLWAPARDSLAKPSKKPQGSGVCSCHPCRSSSRARCRVEKAETGPGGATGRDSTAWW